VGGYIGGSLAVRLKCLHNNFPQQTEGFRAGFGVQRTPSVPDEKLMCVMAILYKTARNTPILVAANREERVERPTVAPKIQSGKPRVVCGIDQQAGGTWLGVNQHGMLAAVTNRPKRVVPPDPRSRGLLCRELLAISNAKEAAQWAASELAKERYDGANYLCADADYAAVVYGGDDVEIVALPPGLHTISDGNLNDRRDPRQEFVRRTLTLHMLDSAVTFLAVGSQAFARKCDADGRRGVILRDPRRPTVSSTLLSLSDKISTCIYQYSPGPPCDHSYDDLSALLRQVLSTDKARKAREEAGNHTKSR